MKIDIGAPSEYGVSGIKKRIEKLRKIKEIPYGMNLDLGTGVGAYYPKLKEYSKTLYAFDGELSYLKEFPKNNPKDSNKIFLSTAENISLKDEVFDAVFSIEVLEHVKNLDLTLKEISRILKQNGLLFITVPNKYFPVDTHMVHFGKFYIKGRYVPFFCMFDSIHKKIGTARRFSEKNIRNDFIKYCFEVIGTEYMMPPFDYFRFGRSLLRKFSTRVEKSFLKHFSMTLIAVLRKI